MVDSGPLIQIGKSGKNGGLAGMGTRHTKKWRVGIDLISVTLHFCGR